MVNTHSPGSVDDLTVDSIREIAHGLSREIGDDFFKSVAKRLVKVLDADYAFIGETRENPPTSIRTVAVNATGEINENFEYSLAGTPCARVVNGELCVFSKDVQQSFPEDTGLSEMGIHAYVGAPLHSVDGRVNGLIVVLFKHAIEDVEKVKAILQILAARTAAEIERKQAHEQRRLSEERMELAFEGADLGFWDWNIQTGDIYFRDDFFLTLGYDKGEHPRENPAWLKLLHPDDRQMVEDKLAQALERKKPVWEFEFRMKAKDGSLKWILSRGRVVESDIDGNHIRAAGTHLDITHRIVAKNALKASEERYKNLIRRLPSGIQECDSQGFITFASESYERMMGYDPGEAIGKRIWDVLEDPGVENELKAYLEHLVAEQPPPTPYVSKNRTKDGRSIDVQVDWDYIRNDEGQTTGFASIVSDISKRVVAERALRENENQLATLFNEMVAAFAVHEVIFNDSGHGIDYRFLDVNPAFEKLTGLEKERIIGRTVKEVLPNTEDYWIDRFCNVAVTGEPIHFENYSGDLHRYFEVSAFYAGENRFAVTFMDTTERRQANLEKERLEANLRQSQKMEAIGTLAGGIAHDFNNILMAILGYSEVALYDLPDNAPARKSIEEVLRAGKRARDIVSRILAFSRKSDEDDELVDISALVLEALQMLRATLPKTIDFETRINSEAGFVSANSTQLHQVIVNLCTNAFQAMPHGGVLTVSLEPPGTTTNESDKTKEAICLIVSDTGFGMSPATVERAFEPYFTTKQEGRGTGLGLAVVHGIISACGGTITIDSEIDKGTTVTVLLPPYKGEPAIRDEAFETPTQGMRRILYVDDEASLAKLGARMLTSLGYKAEALVGGREALDRFNDDPDSIDLVITDLTMPEMTGIDLAQEILKLKPDLPIVLCTGFSELAVEKTALEIGIKKFVIKPIDRTMLSKIVEDACNII